MYLRLPWITALLPNHNQPNLTLRPCYCEVVGLFWNSLKVVSVKLKICYLDANLGGQGLDDI